jgi:hypothetical protein
VSDRAACNAITAVSVSATDTSHTKASVLSHREARSGCDVDLYVGDSAISRDELLKRVAGVDAIVCLLTDTINAEVWTRPAAAQGRRQRRGWLQQHRRDGLPARGIASRTRPTC